MPNFEKKSPSAHQTLLGWADSKETVLEVLGSESSNQNDIEIETRKSSRILKICSSQRRKRVRSEHLPLV